MLAEEYLARSQLFRILRSRPHGQLVELAKGLGGVSTWSAVS